MIKLSEILKELERDNEINSLPLHEQIDTETYIYLAEIRMDMANHYPYKIEGRGYYEFIDKQGYVHFDRLLKEHDRWELKMGYFDPKDKNKPIYTRPKIYVNLDYDEKVFSTHIKIVIDEIVPYFFGHEMVPAEDRLLFLPALDYPRYRLYRMALNKFLDTSKYKFYDDLNNKNTLVIEKILV